MKSVKIENFIWPHNVGDDWIASVKRTGSMKHICKHWPRKRTVVQAGGSYGIWPYHLSKEFDLVYTFEPHWKSFYYLNLNCPAKNVIKMQAALSNVDKGLALGEKSFASHKIVNGLGYIPGLRLDTLRLLSCDAIMLDVEGYEFKALQGAKNTIKEFRPVLLFEYRENIAEFHGIVRKELDQFLERYEYEWITTIHCDEIWAPKEVAWRPPKPTKG